MNILKFARRELVIADDDMEKTLRLARKAASCSASILICGESGTGKELIARYVHEQSERSKEPYVTVNCAAIPDGLMESELFGFERGAFTGAVNQKIGKFERAHGGTILLDEVSEMSVNLQAKLLRVLQEGEVDRLGGKKPIAIDSRIIATTNRNPVEQVAEGTFREDLFYRLNVVHITCPALRGREGAIRKFADAFVELSARKLNCKAPKISEPAYAKLISYSWPGNIRELQNTMERSVLLCESDILEAEGIELFGNEWKSSSQTLAQVEQEQIRRTLENTGGHRERTAKILGISPRTLRNKLRAT